jgi:hypothetical protein
MRKPMTSEAASFALRVKLEPLLHAPSAPAQSGDAATNGHVAEPQPLPRSFSSPQTREGGRGTDEGVPRGRTTGLPTRLWETAPAPSVPSPFAQERRLSTGERSRVADLPWPRLEETSALHEHSMRAAEGSSSAEAHERWPELPPVPPFAHELLAPVESLDDPDRRRRIDEEQQRSGWSE